MRIVRQSNLDKSARVEVRVVVPQQLLMTGGCRAETDFFLLLIGISDTIPHCSKMTPRTDCHLHHDRPDWARTTACQLI